MNKLTSLVDRGIEKEVEFNCTYRGRDLYINMTDGTWICTYENCVFVSSRHNTGWECMSYIDSMRHSLE